MPGMEAHGGYSFCGFASLVLMGQEHIININNLLVRDVFIKNVSLT